MKENLLGMSYYQNNKKKIWSLFIISSIISILFTNIIMDYFRFESFKNKWISVFESNKQTISEMATIDDMRTGLYEMKVLLNDSLHSIDDTNDTFEYAEILLYNKAIEIYEHLEPISRKWNLNESDFKEINRSIDVIDSKISGIKSLKRFNLINSIEFMGHI